MKNISFIIFSLIATFYSVSAQPPGGEGAPKTEYELDKIEERSKKGHKDADEIKDANNKAMNKANKKAEKDRKEKLAGKKKKADEHKFNF